MTDVIRVRTLMEHLTRPLYVFRMAVAAHAAEMKRGYDYSVDDDDRGDAMLKSTAARAHNAAQEIEHIVTTWTRGDDLTYCRDLPSGRSTHACPNRMVSNHLCKKTGCHPSPHKCAYCRYEWTDEKETQW